MVEVLRAAYAALNRGDVGAVVEVLDAGVEWIEPAEVGGGRRLRGVEAVTAHLVAARGAWAEGGCEPERFVVAGERVVVVVRVRVRMKGETLWREGRVVDVYTSGGGKVVEKRTFMEEGEAVAWAGGA
ncbi:MAG: nuclear transport factor 2 family protein [Phycisphaerae bacterium]